MANELTKTASKVGRDVFGKVTDRAADAYDSGMNFLGNYTQQIKDKDYRMANPRKFGNGITAEEAAQIPENGYLRGRANVAKSRFGEVAKGFGTGALLSGGMYGLSAYATDNSDNDASDRMLNVAKHGVAAGVDIAADAGLSGVAAGLATFGGPWGVAAGGTLMAFNMFAGFLGVDAGSLVMNAMNFAEADYEEAKKGPKFNMTQNSSMAMQRQIQNLHASGSNLGEMMHN